MIAKMNMNEIEIHKNLEHPNIIKLIDFFDDHQAKKRFLVLEYVEGGSLESDNNTSMKPLCPKTAWSFFVDLVSALDYLHHINIVHRDIKPSNLLISKENHLKISDFGVSIDSLSGRQSIAALTGSSAFLSPEVVSGFVTRSTSAADVWAAGVTLYFMLFGSLPFYDEQVYKLYGKICHAEPKIPPFLDPLVKHLLCSMLDKNPDTRINAKQLLLHPWVQLGPLNDSILITDELEIANRSLLIKEEDSSSIHTCSASCIHSLLPNVFKSETQIDVDSDLDSENINVVGNVISKIQFDVRKLMNNDSENENLEDNWAYSTETHSENNCSSSSNNAF
ncbi:hypothetical protein GEMRC1_006762 [Eukaryota sp. GEM-RC1]